MAATRAEAGAADRAPGHFATCVRRRRRETRALGGPSRVPVERRHDKAVREITDSVSPLIVTLEADTASQDRFDAARARWFPPERNLVPAHVTLFHHLPGERVDEVRTRLRGVTRDMPPPPFRVASVMPLGRGAGYRLDWPAGDGLRRAIGAGFEVTAQDQGRLRAHVTVQNKVSRETAAATLEALRATFAPWDGHGVALLLWWYRGGPWDPAGRFPFAAPDPAG